MGPLNPAIQIEQLSAGYRETPILHDLCLTIPQGGMTGVIGPNGAGKTTLLRVVTGLIKPKNGTIRLFDADLRHLNARQRSRLVGVVPQNLEPPMAFTVEEIVMMGRTAMLSRWRQPSDDDDRIVERAMVYTDVIDMRNRPVSELSGGEKQRAVIAMVLAQQPRLILMDEATSHLDINHRLEIMQIVERLNREEQVTVLMVSHDLNLAAEFCRQLVLLDHGRLHAQGTPADVLTDANLRHVYHCDVHVQQSPATGRLTVTPARRLAAPQTPQSPRVHVVAGGGCGGEILRRLSLCGYVVTCGVLNQGDSDADTAAALDIETALERPFSHVGPAALAKARALIKQARVVIVSGVPFGPGNLANLDLARDALAEGTPVLIMDDIATRDYTSDRRAHAAADALLEAGAQTWQSTADLFDLLASALAPPDPLP